jgi:hypothetical protein
MGVALKAPPARSPRPVELAPVVKPAPVAAAAPAPVEVYRPDIWGLWFWLACAGILLLLQVIDWVNSLFAMMF